MRPDRWARRVLQALLESLALMVLLALRVRPAATVPAEPPAHTVRRDPLELQVPLGHRVPQVCDCRDCWLCALCLVCWGLTRCGLVSCPRVRVIGEDRYVEFGVC